MEMFLKSQSKMNNRYSEEGKRSKSKNLYLPPQAPKPNKDINRTTINTSCMDSSTY